MSDEKRERGSGNYFRDKGSRNWRIRYSDHGVMRRESTHSSDLEVAKKLLKRRLAEIETQTFTPRTNVRMAELFDDVVFDYTNEGQATKEIQGRWTLHLEPFFGRLRATDVGTNHLQRYIKLRREEGASPATINRELSIVRRGFNLALDADPPKVKAAPRIKKLAESDPRTGFLTPEHHSALAQACTSVGGLALRSIFECGVSYGWRLKELTGVNGLKVSQVDFAANSIRLEVGKTKNGDGRLVAMTSTVRELLLQLCVGKKPKDYVFTRERDGSPVISFRRAWEAACCAAGVGRFVCRDCDEVVDADRRCAACNRRFKADDVKYDGLIFHDLRRTAVSGMVDAGIPEKVAMTISGHKTRAIFDRYHIVPKAQLRDAARKMEAHRAQQVEAVAATETEQETRESASVQ
jgi:integrase